MDTVVERELELNMVLSPERSVPVPARLTYRTADPYAVHITFHIGSEHPVHWTFARELLVEGVFRPCGNGDVRIWPTKVEGRSVVLLALTSPDGEALLEASAAQLSAWLELTLRAAPPGSEAGQIAFDDELAELLSPAPAPARTDDLKLRDPSPAFGGESPRPADEPQDGEAWDREA
ncbi:SsgA family sporulation/cell division regulator [Streptomyces sp. NPDC057445]|uniref:SsgA family sporulation/cell division regulator n=1 Tax=Streptomyces sp. NPDC057445 TaxID=3346136 RepID=UPI003689A53B